MFIPCSACTHIKQSTNEEGLTETYCEVLFKRGEESWIADDNSACIADLSENCGSFSWNRNLDTIIRSLADLWKRVMDIEDSDYKLMRLPRRK